MSNMNTSLLAGLCCGSFSFYFDIDSLRILLRYITMSQYDLFSLHSGNYGDAITLETLKDFHRRRVQILANSGADLIAFETIPNKLEAKVYIYICMYHSILPSEMG